MEYSKIKIEGKFSPKTKTITDKGIKYHEIDLNEWLKDSEEILSVYEKRRQHGTNKKVF